MLSRLSILLSLVAVTAAANPTEPLGENSPRMWTVTLSASVDGSGVFHFSDEALKYKHKHWGHPQHCSALGLLAGADFIFVRHVFCATPGVGYMPAHEN